MLQVLYRNLQELELTKKAVMGVDIGCSLLAWDALPINTFQTHHGRVVPTMVGFKRAKKDSVSIALTGDGGAYSIGMQSLLWAAIRNEPVFVIVVNNAVYAMTGGQTAPTSIEGQVTDTAPVGNTSKPVLGPELIRNLNKDAYLARGAVNNVKELMEMMRKGLEVVQAGNFAMLEVLSFCPTNWKTRGIETNKFLEEKLKPIFKLGEL